MVLPGVLEGLTEETMEYVLLALLVGLLSWNLTKENIGVPLREAVQTFNARLSGDIVRAGVKLERIDAPRWLEVLAGKAAYLVGCDYCAAHWLAALVLLVLQPGPLALAGWRGYVLGWGVLVAGSALWTTGFGIYRRWYTNGWLTFNGGN